MFPKVNSCLTLFTIIIFLTLGIIVIFGGIVVFSLFLPHLRVFWVKTPNFSRLDYGNTSILYLFKDVALEFLPLLFIRVRLR